MYQKHKKLNSNEMKNEKQYFFNILRPEAYQINQFQKKLNIGKFDAFEKVEKLGKVSKNINTTPSMRFKTFMFPSKNEANLI